MHTGTGTVRLLELARHDIAAGEVAVNGVALRVSLLACRAQRLAREREFGTHPIRRQPLAAAVRENETGELPVRRKDLERAAIRRQPAAETIRQPKGKMRARQLQFRCGITVGLACEYVGQTSRPPWSMKPEPPGRSNI